MEHVSMLCLGVMLVRALVESICSGLKFDKTLYRSRLMLNLQAVAYGPFM